MTTQTKLMILCGAWVLIVFVLASEFSYRDAQLEQKMYCNQVAQWKLTNGELGHPDYDGTYQTMCHKDG